MTNNFDFHDTFSVLIPGGLALGILTFLYCGTAEGVFELVSALSIGDSIVLLGAGYIIGELTQALGKYFVKTFISSNSLDDPYNWIFETPKDDSSDKAPFIPQEACERVWKSLCTEFGWQECNELKINIARLNSCFYHIKMKVYAVDAYRTECIKMLSKLHFFSSLLAICMLTPFAYLLKLAFSEICPCCGPCCGDLCDCPCCPFRILLPLFCLGVCVICGFASYRCYLDFNRTYSRCLYTSYLAVLEQEKH